MKVFEHIFNFGNVFVLISWYLFLAWVCIVASCRDASHNRRMLHAPPPPPLLRQAGDVMHSSSTSQSAVASKHNHS